MADLSNPIQYVKDLNYKIPAGQEGQIMLALAKYAAQDSNFTNQQLGPKGQAVAKVTAYLCKVNPNFNKIIASEIPAAKAELKEYSTWSKSKLREGAISRKAKRVLAMALLALGLGTASLSAAGAQEVVTPPPTTTMSVEQQSQATALSTQGTNMNSISITDFERQEVENYSEKDADGVSGILHLVTPFTSVVSFETKDGIKGKIQYTIGNQISCGKFMDNVKSKKGNNISTEKSTQVSKTYLWYNSCDNLECEGQVTDERKQQIADELLNHLGKVAFSSDIIHSLEQQVPESVYQDVNNFFDGIVD